VFAEEPVAVAPVDDADEEPSVADEASDEKLWTRSRDFDWGD
jgi:hypothetical protein